MGGKLLLCCALWRAAPKPFIVTGCCRTRAQIALRGHSLQPGTLLSRVVGWFVTSAVLQL